MSSLEDVVRAIVRDEVAAMLREQAPGPPREWLTSAQAADYLGVSVGTVHNLVSAGRLPRHGPRGHRLMLRRADLDAYLTGACCTPSTELPSDHYEEGRAPRERPRPRTQEV